MVKLFCALVGGSVFSVRIEEGDSVDDLKEAIKTKKSHTITCDADDLDLYLAKKDSAWLTENEVRGVSDTSGLKHLNAAQAELDVVGLSEDDVGHQVDKYQVAAGNGPVNVLVVIPSKMLRIGVDAIYSHKISSYMEIAERLKDSEEVRSLSRHVANVIAEGKRQNISTPFVVLENSSGTGKTQMAFNLQARGDCDVFYIVCGKPGDREQTVYDAYAERTSAFQGCVRSDLEALKRVTIGNRESLGAVGQIRGHTTLALYGFILAALRGQDTFCGEAQRSDVVHELDRRQGSGAKPFVFFLDEFPRAGRTQTRINDMDQWELENSLRTMRNVFRSFNLAVVVSSTNGTARNLLTTSSRSRESEPYLWCVVVPSFPRVVLNGIAAVPALVMEIISHSRPLFAQIAIKYVQDNPYIGDRDLGNYLNAMASALAPLFGSFKKRSYEFDMGQLCLLLCTSYRVVDDKVNTIDGHFARLLEHSPFELQLDARGQLWKDGGAWECRCVLPLPEEDMLLHLTMAGGPSFRPFEERLYMVISPKIQPPLHCDNTEQRSNDGMGLEALTAAAIVLASHAGGFGGVAFPTFLRELLFELGVHGPGMTLQLPQDVKNAGGETLIVPFLSPPNAKWPEWLLTDSSTRFDNIVRTRNEDGIDFRTTSNLISGECKDYSGAVNLDVMKKILVRIPAESIIHLVVVNTLQTQYFTAKSSWEGFVLEHSLQNVDVYRVSKESTLREIGGMSNNSSSTATMARRTDKLVLFIELG